MTQRIAADWHALVREVAKPARPFIDGAFVEASTAERFETVNPPTGETIAPDATFAQDEIFGPVLAASVCDTEDEAAEQVNNTIYGLSALLWTADLGRAHRLTRAISSGTVAVNTVDAVSIQTPFGGTKQSDIGRDEVKQ